MKQKTEIDFPMIVLIVFSIFVLLILGIDLGQSCKPKFQSGIVVRTYKQSPYTSSSFILLGGKVPITNYTEHKESFHVVLRGKTKKGKSRIQDFYIPKSMYDTLSIGIIIKTENLSLQENYEKTLRVLK